MDSNTDYPVDSDHCHDEPMTNVGIEHCNLKTDHPIMSHEFNHSSEYHGPEHNGRQSIDYCNPETEIENSNLSIDNNLRFCETIHRVCGPEYNNSECVELNPKRNNPVMCKTNYTSKEYDPEHQSLDPITPCEPNQNYDKFSPRHIEHCNPKTDDTELSATKNSFGDHSSHVVTLLELSKSSWARSPNAQKDVQPYLRGCKWSPDGTCCLAVVNNDGVHICELSRDLYADSPAEDRIVDVLDSVIHVKEAGLVYDFCWFPLMNSAEPESCCWITTLQNSPIQMWDAFDGSLRCSYRGFNAVDEMEPALSVIFTPDGSKIIAGYKNMLRSFDVNSPGRDCAEHKISSPASCMAVHTNILAVGSWNSSVSLYNVSETSTYKSIGKMYGHSGGVTHMKFSPDGLYLVTGARNDSKLLVWDIRYYRRPLNIFSRHVDTNQRIYFDISPCGKQLASGATDGVVKIWDNWYSAERNPLEDNDNAMKYPLHKDCCNSLSYHPLRPIIATGSGQYHLEDPLAGDESEDRLLSESMQLTTPPTSHKYSTVSENNLTFWWMGDLNCS